MKLQEDNSKELANKIRRGIEEIKAVLPGVEVLLVDGEMFSWYGSRLKKAVAYLQQLVQ